MSRQRLLNKAAAGLAAALAMLAQGAWAQLIRLEATEFDPIVQAGSAAARATADRSLPGLASLGDAREPLPGEKRLTLMQWASPVQPEDLQAVVDAGGKLIQPIPDHAWLVALPESKETTAARTAAAFSARVGRAPRWTGAFRPGWKMERRVAIEWQAWNSAGRLKANDPDVKRLRYTVQFAHTGGEKRALGLVSIGAPPRRHSAFDGFETWIADATPAEIDNLIQENCVLWVAPYVEPKMRGERDSLVTAGQLNTGATCVVGSGLSYQNWLNSVALGGDGQIVHIMDDGLSQGIATNAPGTAHPDIIGRIAGIHDATNDPLGNSTGGHGHINASIIMGRPLAGGGLRDAGGYLLGQGVAPNAQIYATKIFNNSGRFDIGNEDFSDLARDAYQHGARISSNSWGADVGGQYTADSQAFDLLARDADDTAGGLQQMLFVFAAGNDGPGNSTIGSPATGKNVVAVGANENCDQQIIDGCGAGPADADNLNDMANFSSRGPTSDGRLGPTVIDSGTHVTGAASDSASFDASGVCGRMQGAGVDASQRRYYPAGQTFYTWSSGTSHSTPLTAGAATLLFQYFQRQLGQAPSPALLKAALVAGASDTAGGNVNDPVGSTLPHIPNIHAGWGRVNLSTLVSGNSSQFVINQTQVLQSSGARYETDIQVSDAGQPFKIVLAWTDPAASLAAAKKLVNDLDLTVSNGISTWKGNVFSNGFSITGGNADRLNNLESVFIQTPQPGVYHVTIEAHEILGDALPGQGGLIEQDFALFIGNGSNQSPIGRVFYNREFYACGQPLAISVTDSDLRGAGTATATVYNPTRNDLENVTLHEIGGATGIMQGTLATTPGGAAVNNNGVMTAGDGDTLYLSYQDATLGQGGQPLVATDNAVVDCTPPNIVSLLAESPSESRAVLRVSASEPVRIKVEAGPSCGTFTTTFEAQDSISQHEVELAGLSQCSVVFYRITLTDRAGNVSVFDENGACYALITSTVAADYTDDLEPSPNPGWSHSSARGTDDWNSIVPSVAGGALPKSPTHAWYTNDVATIKDARLVTPALAVQAGGRVTFWHTFAFEAGATLAFDGGVLEISTDDGETWLDAKPFIVEGGYNATISASYQNPLAGREAWSNGDLGQMSRVLVDLASFAGQSVRLRFRIGCDNSTAGPGSNPGWYIDNFSLERVVPCVGDLAQVFLDADSVRCDTGSIRVRIFDTGLSQALGQVPGPVTLAPGNGFSGPSVPLSGLQRIDPAGIFEGFLSLQPTGFPREYLIGGALKIKEGDAFRLIYTDPSGGGASRLVTAQARIDCTPPALLSLAAEDVLNDRATLRLTADEPVRATIRMGTVCGAPTLTVEYASPQSEIELPLLKLLGCTSYFYQVTLTDAAGNQAVFDNQGQCYGFRTLSAQGAVETMEGTPFSNGWTQTQTPSNATLQWQTANTSFNHSPAKAARAFATSSISESRLISPATDIAAGARLTFWHTYQFETGFDGGVIEISLDGGSNWLDLGGDISEGGYNGTVNTSFGNPIAGRQAWTGGVRATPTRVTVELTNYAGPGRKIRWRLGCDSSTSASGDGWYVDDVTIANFSVCGLDFPAVPAGFTPVEGTDNVPFDAFQLLDWSDAARATQYRAFFGLTPTTLGMIGEAPASQATLPQAPTLKADTAYFWRVLAINATGATAGPLLRFRTREVDTHKLAQEIVGQASGLSAQEKQAVDYNDDSRLGIDDLVKAINKKQE